jgi:hypothetical protein
MYKVFDEKSSRDWLLFLYLYFFSLRLLNPHILTTSISTRRFNCRPSSVSFPATGRVSP